MTSRIVVFDLDGTLWDFPAGHVVDYDDPVNLEAVVPHERACKLVKAAWAAGWEVAYLTGRGEHVREVTERCLRLADLPPGAVMMQAKWVDYATMRRFKAHWLGVLKAEYAQVDFVGDHAEDEAAARLAGVGFFHAALWRGEVARAASGVPA